MSAPPTTSAASSRIGDAALDTLFRAARSVHAFSAKPVEDDVIEALYDILKWGPTAFNAQPGRFLFVRSAQAKARLAPALSPGNRNKTLAAPATVIVAHDSRFFERLPEPNPRVADLFASNERLALETAFRNGTLQGAYLLLAARAVGLAVGPMSGFDAAAVDREFFPDGRHRVNFLANLGYAAEAEAAARPRGARFAYSDVVQIL